MLSFIRGSLEEVSDGIVVVENNGIGYEINTSMESISKFGELGSDVKVYTKLIPREDAINLYGFADMEEKRMFELLLTVSGIGPKGALSILSSMTVNDINCAVAEEDAKAFAKVPGVGKKTAERAIVDLKDKVDMVAYIDTKNERAIAKTKDTKTIELKTEVIDALVSLGYSSSAAKKAIESMTITESSTVEQLLSDTLKQMSFL